MQYEQVMCEYVCRLHFFWSNLLNHVDNLQTVTQLTLSANTQKLTLGISPAREAKMTSVKVQQNYEVTLTRQCLPSLAEGLSTLDWLFLYFHPTHTCTHMRTGTCMDTHLHTPWW